MAAGAAAGGQAQVATAGQGAVVVAMGDDAAPAARALAREVYSDEALRPRIDDATARVLVGDPPPVGSAPRLAELAEIRKAAHTAGTDTVSRKLLQSLGADLGASMVLAVSVRGDRPVARVLVVPTGIFLPIELPGSMELQPDGTSRPKWTGVSGVLGTFAKSGAAVAVVAGGAGTAQAGAKEKPPGPLAPKKDEPSRSFWTSPWTWAGVGAVVVVGVVVFALTQTQTDDGGLRLQGRVSP
ncbi:MAG: hypothetical protein R3B70_20265 [Polyangiaceae bacterium]